MATPSSPALQISAEDRKKAAAQLKQLQRKLLDLTGRNRLLNFRHATGKSLRFVEGDLGAIFEKLVGSGGSVELMGLPDPKRADYTNKAGRPERPEEETWARRNQIPMSYDLSAATGALDAQTLLYGDVLVQHCRRIERDARSALEETGANMLHLVFGFLRFPEGPTNDDAFEAPLVAVPVRMSGQSRGSSLHYSITYTGDDISENLSLREKLRQDFGVELPDLFDDQKSINLECYLKQMGQLAADRPGFAVLRGMSLCLLSFTNMLLCRDLDLAHWDTTGGNLLLQNPLACTILGIRESRAETRVPSEADRDIEADPDRSIPLVFDADGSQHIALADVLVAGRSIVIEGPPGTGKSQTIANLIAACLGCGKSVLFVAEKMAALNVVKDRLHQVGLSPFLLELHSDKSRTRRVIGDLERRIGYRGGSTDQLARALQDAERQRKLLRAYADLMNSVSFNRLGLTLHQVIWKMERSRQELRGNDQRLRASIVTGSADADADDLESSRSVLASLALKRNTLGPYDPDQTYWGFFPRLLLPGDEQVIAEILADARAGVVGLADAAAELARQVRAGAIGLAPTALEQERAALLTVAGKIGPNFPGRIFPALWNGGEKARAEIAAFIERLGAYRELQSAARDWNQQTTPSHTATKLHQRLASIADALEAPVDSAYANGRLTAVRTCLKQLNLIFEAIQTGRLGQATVLAPLPPTAPVPAHNEGAGSPAEVGGAELGEVHALARAWQELHASLNTVLRLDLAPSRVEIENAVHSLRRKRAWYRFLEPTWRAALELHRSLRRSPTRVRASQRAAEMEAILGLWDLGGALLGCQAELLRQAIAAEVLLARPAWLGDLFQGLRTDSAPLNAMVELADELRGSPLAPWLKAAVARNPEPEFCRDLAAALQALRGGFDRLGGLCSALEQFGEFQPETWAQAKPEEDLVRYVTGFLARLQRADGTEAALLPWSEYVELSKKATAQGLGKFLETVEAARLDPRLWPEAFSYCFYSSIARVALQATPGLERFISESPEETVRKFRDQDRLVVALRAKAVAAHALQHSDPPRGDSGGRVSELTEMSLVNHLLPQQQPRVRLRDLLRRAGRAMQALQPCFLMSPQAVAQYLDPAHLFNIVIMDEASQIKPEEAMGAIARGRQLVVVGDPKQLPPTTFFSRMAQDDAEDDLHVTTDAESILNLCLSRLPSRQLLWHYRSSHQSLIAFSNHHFYDGRLIVFPSPYGQGSRLGLRAIFLRDAVYDHQRNQREAERVVGLVVEHILSAPEGSLGVVTLNLQQRDLIDELLRVRLESVPGAEEFRSRWDNAGYPLFVKNLENVQGDERDTIIVSVTFGKPPGVSVVRQNFGPISREGGWRRLNVLFTRARKSLTVVTSMLPEDVLVDAATPQGTRVLRDYLEYLRNGQLTNTTETGLDPESDFEASVIAILRRHGYECTPQLGVAGYRIDIAVRDPSNAGAYIAAIECDGASYHSARSVRDRDRIRQEILEAQGWRGRIWRIWSTAYFRNPEAEGARLLEFLDHLRKSPRTTEAGAAKSWTEEVVATTPLLPGAPPPGSQPACPEQEPPEVRVGCTVTYANLTRPGESYRVSIANDRRDLSGGVIAVGAPLAQCLLGASVGDEPILRIPGAPPQKLRVLGIIQAPIQ